MPLGSALWKSSEGFYRSLTLAQHGIAPEQEFARRPKLVKAFGNYAEFWRLHVCPATTRPIGDTFRPGASRSVCRIAQKSYSIMLKLLDAEDSLKKVRSGDFGLRYRNWRDGIEAAGNALQLTSELQYAIAGNPKKPKLPSLGTQLGVVLDPFPNWDQNWADDREMASKYRNYLVHEGAVFTVNVHATGQTLVLGRSAFAARVDWKDADASYKANPSDWHPIQNVGQEVFDDTIAFIDLSYGQLLSHMAQLLTMSAYQSLWGWDNNTLPITWSPRRHVRAQALLGNWASAHGSTASTTVFNITSVSSGGCNP